MVIYIELLLVANVLIHLITVGIIRLVTFAKISPWIMISILFDIVYMLLYVYYPSYFIVVKYLFGILLVNLSFRGNFLTRVRSTLLYYGLNVALGGTSFILRLAGNPKYLLVLGVYFLIAVGAYLFFMKKPFKQYYYLGVKMDSSEQVIKVFLDTGCVIYYKNLPVIVLHPRFKGDLVPDGTVELSTAMGTNSYPCYYLPQIKLNGKTLSCYCVFLSTDYDGLIGINIL